MTEAQWQDATTLRLRAIESRIKRYAGAPAGSLDRAMHRMAIAERTQVAACLRAALMTSDTPVAVAYQMAFGSGVDMLPSAA